MRNAKKTKHLHTFAKSENFFAKISNIFRLNPIKVQKYDPLVNICPNLMVHYVTYCHRQPTPSTTVPLTGPSSFWDLSGTGKSPLF
jgi:hypothetical protein